jgi:hypothetical protein
MVNQPPRVYILTWCKSVDRLYGSTLIFKTLRLGFPTAEISIIDNASIPQARIEIGRQADACRARFYPLRQELPHAQFIENTLRNQAHGSAVFVDPDVCFWRSIERWRFDALMAGRLIPRHRCAITHTLTHARLHTSLLWISDVAELLSACHGIWQTFASFSPFRPVAFCRDGQWERFDTGAALFHAFPERMHAFSDQELDAYDHLFCGAHLPYVLQRGDPEHASRLEELHRDVQHDHRALKGAWREQEAYFRSRVVQVQS